MTFTDDDLRRLKEHLEGDCYLTPEWLDARKMMPALLARMEAAESIVNCVAISALLGSYEIKGLVEAWSKAAGK